MKSLSYGVPFLFLATVPLGFFLGGAWSCLTLAVIPVSLCGLDWILGSETASHAEGPGYRLLPWLYIGVQIAVIAFAAAAVAAPETNFVEALGLTLSVGVTAGVFGILAAHEMVHSPVASERALGLAMLACVGYMHFRIAHIHGHHVRGATFDDPATARRGENAYVFIGRSVAGQFREAWAFETARLARRKQREFGFSNRMLLYLAIEFAIAVALAAFDLRSLAFWLTQAVLAIVLLELFNYIAHYGLARRRTAEGSIEPMAPRHSWNSLRRMNNRSLFNMGRHSDHHRRPTKEYQHLAADPQAPQLPSGYAGSILCALIPPLWRGIMDPKVEFWSRTTP